MLGDCFGFLSQKTILLNWRVKAEFVLDMILLVNIYICSIWYQVIILVLSCVILIVVFLPYLIIFFWLLGALEFGYSLATS